MIRSFLISSLFLLCFALFECAVLSNLFFLPAIPDFLLLVTTYISIKNGRMFGVTLGFTGGLFLDFLSASPFGLNCLLRTSLGYIAGLFNKTLNTEGFFIPVILGAGTTVVKILGLALISILFPYALTNFSFVSQSFFFEIIFNALLAPFVFKFLAIFSHSIELEPEKVS